MCCNIILSWYWKRISKLISVCVSVYMCGREGIRKDKLRIFFIAAMMGVLFGRNVIKCWVKKKKRISFNHFFLISLLTAFLLFQTSLNFIWRWHMEWGAHFCLTRAAFPPLFWRTLHKLGSRHLPPVTLQKQNKEGTAYLAVNILKNKGYAYLLSKKQLITNSE